MKQTSVRTGDPATSSGQEGSGPSPHGRDEGLATTASSFRDAGRFTKGSGFTLLELIVTLAIAGMMIAVLGVSIQGARGAYSRQGAARRVLAAVRKAQSLAITRGGVFQVQWGGAGGLGLPASQFRIVRDTTGSCSFPSVNAAVDGTNVIEGWSDLALDYQGATIQSIVDSGSHALGGVMFNALGASVNTCATVTFPVTLTLSSVSGRARNIQVLSAGGATIQ